MFLNFKVNRESWVLGNGRLTLSFLTSTCSEVGCSLQQGASGLSVTKIPNMPRHFVVLCSLERYTSNLGSLEKYWCVKYEILRSDLGNLLIFPVSTGQNTTQSIPFFYSHNTQPTTVQVIISSRSLVSFFFPYFFFDTENTEILNLPFYVCYSKVVTNLLFKITVFVFRGFTLCWSVCRNNNLQQKKKGSLSFDYGGAVPHSTSQCRSYGSEACAASCNSATLPCLITDSGRYPSLAERDLEPSLPIRGGPY